MLKRRPLEFSWPFPDSGSDEPGGPECHVIVCPLHVKLSNTRVLTRYVRHVWLLTTPKYENSLLRCLKTSRVWAGNFIHTLSSPLSPPLLYHSFNLVTYFNVIHSIRSGDLQIGTNYNLLPGLWFLDINVFCSLLEERMTQQHVLTSAVQTRSSTSENTSLIEGLLPSLSPPAQVLDNPYWAFERFFMEVKCHHNLSIGWHLFLGVN